MQIRQRIREDVNAGMEKQQREFLLRKQMDSIRKELGEDDASVVEEYRTKIDEAGMPEAVRSRPRERLARFERMGESSPESQMIRSYLDWLLAVPWGTRSDEVLDPVRTAGSSTQTTPVSRTSRTGSSSTSPSRSSARSAGSSPTSAPARS